MTPEEMKPIEGLLELCDKMGNAVWNELAASVRSLIAENEQLLRELAASARNQADEMEQLRRDYESRGWMLDMEAK